MKNEIIEKLTSLGLTAEDVNELDKEFNEAVDSRVHAEVDILTEKSEKYITEKVNALSAAKSKELEAKSNKAIKEKIHKLESSAAKQLNERTEEIMNAASEYIKEYFDNGFKLKYGDELKALEERMVANLDRYLDYAINENINEDLLRKVAINETFEPIIKGIQQLFEEQYVPLDLSGSGKIREYEKQLEEYDPMLQNMLHENMELTDIAEKCAKRALIAEKTADFSGEDRKRIKKFFNEKSFKETTQDIDAYCNLIKESNEKVEDAKKIDMVDSSFNRKPYGDRDYNKLVKEASRNIVKSRYKTSKANFLGSKSQSKAQRDEDVTYDFINEKINEFKKKASESENYLEQVSKMCEEI